MIHALKTWPEYYKEVVSGNKTFEVRKNDRSFKVGDTLLLQEWNPAGYGNYTGEEHFAQITYILHGGAFGIDKEYLVMGIKDKENF